MENAVEMICVLTIEWNVLKIDVILIRDKYNDKLYYRWEIIMLKS